MKILNGIMLIILLVVVIVACKKESSTPVTCNGDSISFSTQVAPIIASKCATSGCHNSGSGKGPGALVTYSQIFNARSSVSRSITNGSMPPGGMTQTEKQTVVCWINNGAPNN